MGGALGSGVSALYNSSETLLPLLYSPPCKGTMRIGHLYPERGLSPEPRHAGTQIAEFLASRTKGN